MSREDVLVTTQWAEDNLDTAGVVFAEVDEDTTAYDNGHIRGAVKFDWRKDLQDGVRRDFVSKEGFERLLSEKGISNDDLVILYGGNNNWFAAYAYWYFKLYGHEKVKLLDGGRKNFVDVRSPDEFSGKLLAPAHLPQEQSQVPGHIPGALNVPWAKVANEDGTFKSEDEIKELYKDEGIDEGKGTIAYCRIGERSSIAWFAIHELLGYEDVKNYDGSWTEYGS